LGRKRPDPATRPNEKLGKYANRRCRRLLKERGEQPLEKAEKLRQPSMERGRPMKCHCQATAAQAGCNDALTWLAEEKEKNRWAQRGACLKSGPPRSGDVCGGWEVSARSHLSSCRNFMGEEITLGSKVQVVSLGGAVGQTANVHYFDGCRQSVDPNVEQRGNTNHCHFEGHPGRWPCVKLPREPHLHGEGKNSEQIEKKKGGGKEIYWQEEKKEKKKK